MNTTSHDLQEPAPGELELVREFVNTYDAETGEESLGSPEQLASWLRGHGLLEDRRQTRPADLDKAIDIREALRSLLLANNGVAAEPAAVERLRQASREAKLELAFRGDGTSPVEPNAPGVAGALGRILTRVHAAMADGSWERLKVCPADDCLWAFYDRSRNRSRRWCDMEVCGNRAKVRGYRERRSRG
jgi:predicted RNA-binding Zn ribbon-like protein